uniref:Uncharacterized protein n=1 Tax=Tetranychus urticae TaxID=32264 RepID=A0A158P4F5_TETUR
MVKYNLRMRRPKHLTRERGPYSKKLIWMMEHMDHPSGLLYGQSRRTFIAWLEKLRDHQIVANGLADLIAEVKKHIKTMKQNEFINLKEYWPLRMALLEFYLYFKDTI